jgi:hypothetical protein
MPPGSATHGTFQSNLSRLIGTWPIASGANCRVVTEPGILTRIRSDWNVRIPDLGVSCTADAPGQQALPDPMTWNDVSSYTTIPSVSGIAVWHSTRVLAACPTRTRGPLA